MVTVCHGRRLPSSQLGDSLSSVIISLLTQIQLILLPESNDQGANRSWLILGVELHQIGEAC
jgi:hypothetical protein